jgi:hypothetical protein
MDTVAATTCRRGDAAMDAPSSRWACSPRWLSSSRPLEAQVCAARRRAVPPCVLRMLACGYAVRAVVARDTLDSGRLCRGVQVAVCRALTHQPLCWWLPRACGADVFALCMYA